MVVHSLHFPLQRLHGIGAHQAVAAIPKDPKQRAIYEQWWRQHGKKRETLRHFIFRQVSSTVPHVRLPLRKNNTPF